MCFTSQKKREDVLCFRDKTSSILREHHANMQSGDEKTQIIKTALKLFCNDNATIDLDSKSYPTAHSMTDIPSQLTLVPDSLQILLRPILKTNKGVAVWWAQLHKFCRPRSGVGPCLMRLAITLDHKCGSQWMLNKLLRLGYTKSYTETHDLRSSL